MKTMNRQIFVQIINNNKIPGYGCERTELQNGALFEKNRLYMGRNTFQQVEIRWAGGSAAIKTTSLPSVPDSMLSQKQNQTKTGPRNINNENISE